MFRTQTYASPESFTQPLEVMEVTFRWCAPQKKSALLWSSRKTGRTWNFWGTFVRPKSPHIWTQTAPKLLDLVNSPRPGRWPEPEPCRTLDSRNTAARVVHRENYRHSTSYIYRARNIHMYFPTWNILERKKGRPSRQRGGQNWTTSCWFKNWVFRAILCTHHYPKRVFWEEEGTFYPNLQQPSQV